MGAGFHKCFDELYGCRSSRAAASVTLLYRVAKEKQEINVVLCGIYDEQECNTGSKKCKIFLQLQESKDCSILVMKTGRPWRPESKPSGFDP